MLQPVETKLGIIYVEMFDDSREESDRIKVFDSEKRYLDYISVDMLENCSNFSGKTIEEKFKAYIDDVQLFKTIEDLLFFFNVNYEFLSTDWKEVVQYMKTFSIDECDSEEKLLTNEWINKIGKYYIVVSEN